MVEEYDMVPRGEHLNCMVDLFGRVGRLDEAVELLKAIPASSDIVPWRSLLARCCTYGNTELGADCFDEAVKLRPDNGSAYLLMASIYANTGMGQDATRMQGSTREASSTKNETFISRFQYHDASEELDTSDRCMKGGDEAEGDMVSKAANLICNIFSRENEGFKEDKRSQICYAFCNSKQPPPLTVS
jgi:pentatricopeptide repeat protein